MKDYLLFNYFSDLYSRQAGYRLCSHIDRVMVLLVEYSLCDDDELREFCLQACEAFVLRCPSAISAHIPTVIQPQLPLNDFLINSCRINSRSLNCV